MLKRALYILKILIYILDIVLSNLSVFPKTMEQAKLKGEPCTTNKQPDAPNRNDT